MATTREAVAAFWSWWPTVAADIDKGIRDEGIDKPLIDAINAHVAAIHDDLDWELGPGQQANHHICLSGKGDPLLRMYAERWLRAAPEVDDTWEFYAARQPHSVGGLRLEIAGHQIALDEFVVSCLPDDAHEVIDLTAHHPTLGAIDDENLRWRVLMIALDTLLGEDDVERWLGSIEISLEPLDDAQPIAQPIAELRQVVDDLAKRATGDRWAVLKGVIGGSPVFVTVNQAIKRLDHLLLDQHVAIDIALVNPTEEGLTTSDEADVLNAMEDQLFEQLGEHAINIGRETTGGRRIIHLHVMSEGPAAAIVDRWRKQHDSYRIASEVSSDPRWEILDRWG